MTHDAADHRIERIGVNPDTVIRGYRFATASSGTGSSDLCILGVGGSSIVYRVFQVLDEKRGIFVPRAMKLFVMRDDLHSEDTSFLPAKDNFLEEIKNVSQLAHENLVQVTDAGEEEFELSDGSTKRIPFIVSHLITGCTLRDVIDGTPQGQSTRAKLCEHPDLAIDLVLQIARGLSYLHSRKFLHCDIAPKNVFIENDGSQIRAIVGDVGMSRNLGTSSREKVHVAGTKSYSPADVIPLFGKEVSIKQLKEWFPGWDVFGFAKTAASLLDSLLDVTDKPWLRAARNRIGLAEKDFRQFKTVEALAEQIEYFKPVHRERGRVPELEPSIILSRKRMMPIEALSLTKRIDKLVRHPALTRLQGVPQLTIVGSVAPGGTHTRYEHSLGVMENVRRMLSLLLDEPSFLEVLQRDSIETGLVAALLYNATRFPFSNIIHELNKRLPPGDKKMFTSFGRDVLFSEILGDTFRSYSGKTLEEQLCKDFAQVDIEKLKRILVASGPADLERPDEVILFTLLNSSLDARVIDFVRRDSLHLGLSSGDFFALDDLLPHLSITSRSAGNDRSIAQVSLRTSGISIAEQIILMRYWLYSRVYWNQPNRAYNAQVRRALLELKDQTAFEHELRSVALQYDERALIKFLLQFAQDNSVTVAAELLKLVSGHEKVLYKTLFERNLRNCDTDPLRNDRSQMELLVSPTMSYRTMRNFEMRLSEWLGNRLGMTNDKGPPLILLDVPFEPGSIKLGTDIFVSVPHSSNSREQQLRTLDKISPVISGVNSNFLNDLQRLRILIRPDLDVQSREEVGSEAYDQLRQLISQ